MMNIRTYFDNLYKNAITDEDFDAITEYEQEVYEMDDLTDWAEENGVDLTATERVWSQDILVLQLWAWEFED